MIIDLWNSYVWWGYFYFIKFLQYHTFLQICMGDTYLKKSVIILFIDKKSFFQFNSFKNSYLLIVVVFFIRIGDGIRNNMYLVQGVWNKGGMETTRPALELLILYIFLDFYFFWNIFLQDLNSCDLISWVFIGSPHIIFGKKSQES